jgi:uncharacterized protein YtpQ (UPF0354 family)
MKPLLQSLALLVCLHGPAFGEIPRPQNPMDTLDMMAEAIRQAEPDLKVEIDRSDLSLKVTAPSGAEIQSFPDNLHIELQAAATGQERDRLLARFIEVALEGLKAADADPALDPDALFPILRPRQMLDGSGATTVPSLEFPGDLVILWVLDSPTSTSSVTAELLEDNGLDTEKLAEKALDNLARKASDIQTSSEDGMTFVLLDEYYESSLMLLPDLWQAIDEDLGTVVAGVPSRDLLIYVDGDNPDDVAELRDLVDRTSGQLSYPVSGDLFRWDGSAWQLLPK